MTAERPARLTPAMRNVVIVVGAVVAVGLIVVIWLLSSGADSPFGSSGSPTPTKSSSVSPTPGPIPGATPTTGSEVQPPSPSESAGAGLPPLPEQTPLVSPPFPASGSASGELVAGFPESVMGPAPGSDILDSSIATEGETMQVTLVARTDASAADVSAHYQALWTSLGLTDVGSADGSLAYANTFTSLTLAFTPASGTGTIYMIFGVFQAG